jgi:hypothetical protein
MGEPLLESPPGRSTPSGVVIIIYPLEPLVFSIFPLKSLEKHDVECNLLFSHDLFGLCL